MHTCQNCGTLEEGAYCSRCGQKQVTGRFTLRSVLSTALAELADVDRGSLATAYRLTTEPGTLVRDYWSRRTQSFINPVRYFLVAVAGYQVVLWQTGRAQDMVRGFLEADHDADVTTTGGHRSVASGGGGDGGIISITLALHTPASRTWYRSMHHR